MFNCVNPVQLRHFQLVNPEFVVKSCDVDYCSSSLIEWTFGQVNAWVCHQSCKLSIVSEVVIITGGLNIFREHLAVFITPTLNSNLRTLFCVLKVMTHAQLYDSQFRL